MQDLAGRADAAAASVSRRARALPDEVLLAFVQVLFGSLSIAGKVAIPQIGPFVLVALRIGFAAIVLVALERWLVGHRVERKEWPLLAGLSLLGVFLNQVFFLVGLSMTSAVEATVLITTIPAFTLAAGLLWKRETWSARRGLGMAIAFGGVLVLLGGSALEFRSAHFLGNLFVVLNASFYAVYLVASRPVLKRIPPLTVTAATFVVAAILVVPVGIFGLSMVQPGKPDAQGIAAVVYIILGPTIATYFLVSYALVRVQASTVAGFIYIQPLIGGVLAVLLLGEPLTPRVLAAGALIFVGVALLALKPGFGRRFIPGA